MPGIVAGILLILMGIAHNFFGELKQIPELRKITSDHIVIGSTRIMIFQGGVIIIAVGLIQLLSALNFIQLVGIARFFPMLIIAINFLVSLTIIVWLHKPILKITVPQFLIFTVILILQYFSVN